MKKLLDSKHIILLNLSLIFLSLICLYFGLKKPITIIEINEGLGLLSKLPITWFISYILIISSAFIAAIKVKNRKIFLLNLIILTLILFGTPMLIEPLARNHDSYWHMSNTLTVIQEKTINPETYKSSNDLLEYNQNFNKDYLKKNPGGFIIFATISSLTGSEDTLFFIKFLPLLLTILISLATYILFKNIFNEKIAKIATIITVLSNIYIHYHLAPATIGIFLMLLIFSQIITNQEKYSLIIILLGLILVLTSLPAYLILALSCIGASIYGLLFKEKPNVNVIILMIILLIGLLYFIPKTDLTNLIFNEILEKILSQQTNPTTIATFSVAKIIRIISLSLISIVTLISTISLINKKEKISFYAGTLFASIIFFLISTFIAGNLNMDDRAYLILFYGAIILSFKYYLTLNKAKNLLLTILILIAIANSFTLYENETFYIFNNQFVKPFDYIFENTDINDKIIASLDYYPTFLLKYGEVRQTNFQTTKFDDNFITKSYTRYNILVFNSKGEYAQKIRGYQENYNKLKERLEKTKNKVYSNKETIIISLN